ncbi:hypothetical protein Q3304_08935 [Clostridioides sp. GD02377]|uniref:hypothetical protein n=1 Tax=unclassified Clostridioides TaxID=2635829 RepID=UPI0038A5C6E6
MKTLFDFGYELGVKDTSKKLPLNEFVISLQKEDKNGILESIIKCYSVLNVALPDFVLKECSSENNLIKSSQNILIGILYAYKETNSIYNLLATEQLLSLKEASKISKRAVTTLRRNIDTGKFERNIDAFQVDSKWLIRKDALIREYGQFEYSSDK